MWNWCLNCFRVDWSGKKSCGRKKKSVARLLWHSITVNFPIIKSLATIKFTIKTKYYARCVFEKKSNGWRSMKEIKKPRRGKFDIICFSHHKMEIIQLLQLGTINSLFLQLAGHQALIIVSRSKYYLLRKFYKTFFRCDAAMC